MKFKPANISLLLIVGLFLVVLFFLLVVFGTEFGNRFGTLYQRKLDQATAAKERQAANGQEPKVSAALAVDQDPAKSAGAVYKVTGSGFLPSSVVFLNFSDPVCCVAIAASPDNLGNISVDRKTGKPGIYRVEAFQRIGEKLLPVASVFFEVTEQRQ